MALQNPAAYYKAADMILAGLGFAPTRIRRNILVAQIAGEKPAGQPFQHNNPLNTTHKAGQSYTWGSQGNISGFDTPEAGVHANVLTMQQSNFAGLRRALEQQNPNAYGRALATEPWGTSASTWAGIYRGLGGTLPSIWAGAASTHVPDGRRPLGQSATELGASGASDSTSLGGGTDLPLSPRLKLPPGFGQWLRQSEADVLRGKVTPLPGGLNFSSFFSKLPRIGAGATATPQPSRITPTPVTTPPDLTAPGTAYRTPFGTTFKLPALPPSLGTRPTAATSASSPKGQTIPLYRWEGELVNTWWVPILNFARKHGWKGTVNSGYRSVAEQAGIAARNPNRAMVARPGGSPHNFGMAIDISDPTTFQRIISQYKLPVWRYAHEAWHFEPAGFRTNGTETGRGGRFSAPAVS